MAIPRNTSSAMAIFILLLVFISELLWSTSEALTQECHVPEVTDGQTGMMVFFIDRRVNFSSDHFFANLIRSDEPDWDILNCDQPNGTSHVGCKINSPKYKSRGVRNHKLTVFIPNITQHYADTYVFQVYINSIAQPPVFCSVLVKKRLQPDINRVIKTETETSPWVIAGVVFLFICSFTLALVVVLAQKRTRASGSNNEDIYQLIKTRIEREQINVHEGMRWFVGNRSDDEVENLFECVKPRAGHFVITQSKADLSSFTLFVCWEGWKDQPKVDRFYITHNDSGFTVNLPNTQFDTLCELVKFYRTNPMHVEGKDLGTLSKPCEEEPKDAWYLGSLSGDKVGKLLFTMHTEEGSFVVTKSSTNEDNYTLSVQFGGKLVPYTIVSRDDGFKITHLTGPFMTLKKLVEHCRKNDLDGLGTLKKSLEIIPEELTTEEKQILEKNGPSSFFFKDSRVPGRRVLAVNSNGEMKQLVIIKSNDGYKLADIDILHRDEVALERYYRRTKITRHGDKYGYLRKNCTHDLEKNRGLQSGSTCVMESK